MRFCFVIFLALLPPAYGRWAVHATAAQGEAFSGAFRNDAGEIVSWGDALRVSDAQGLRSRVIAKGPFGEGACAFGDAVITVRGRGLGDLVAIRTADGRTRKIDSQVEMHDCVAATLLGRHGVLIIHRGMQLRFYQRLPGDRWVSRDIYSIYTPSYQAGLALADVDADGRTDIFCGNYWLRTPERFEESWRLFAINTWFEDAESASLRILVLGPRRIVAAQAHVSPARLAQFDSPSNPELPWMATPLARRLNLSRIHALAKVGESLVAAERNGTGSRIVDVTTGEVIGSNGGTASLVPLDSRTFVTAGPDGLAVWRLTPEASPP